MLVLSRKVTQEIVIGDDIVRITVVAIRGDQVRLGFTAPRGLPIHRQEVYQEIVRANGSNVQTSRGRQTRAHARRPSGAI